MYYWERNVVSIPEGFRGERVKDYHDRNVKAGNPQASYDLMQMLKDPDHHIIYPFKEGWVVLRKTLHKLKPSLFICSVYLDPKYDIDVIAGYEDLIAFAKELGCVYLLGGSCRDSKALERKFNLKVHSWTVEMEL